jgi:gliding motility-associated-like protein
MGKSLAALLLLFVTFAHAQTCSSGLGDPIINITFGAGANFGPPLASGITSLKYQSQACVLDNAYEIVNSTSNCYVGDWLTITADHTGDPNGYYMLIGASDQPSDFYVQTVSGLCPSTNYQFAAWVLNMASHTGEILPNITFNIEKTDGTVLQSLRTGDVPVTNPAKWNQYTFYFTTPPGVSSVRLRMTNNAPGGYGNDLALDDITFRTAGPSVNIAISGYPGDLVTLCAAPANSLQFLGTVGSCYSSTAYQWQQSMDNGQSWNNIPGAVNTNYSANPTNAGSYLYRLTAAQAGNIGISTCQVVSTADSIRVLPVAYPAITIRADTLTICTGAPVSFVATVADGGPTPVYQWMVNGLPAAGNGPQFSSNVLGNGDQVSCRLMSNAVCQNKATSLSNKLTMDVLPIVTPTVMITASADRICTDSLVVFTATFANGGPHPSYQWTVNGQMAAADTNVFSSNNLNNGDVISAVLTGSLPCSLPSTANTISMTVYPRPTISLTPDTVIKGGTRIQLDPLINGAVVSYQWTPKELLDNPFIADPIASPAATTAYTLTVTDANGCSASAKEIVAVFYDMAMPNAFTPNGDGRNDLFRVPPGIPVTITRFAVYDRWGALVFAAVNGSSGWDGTRGGEPQPAGTYVWIIEYFNPLVKQVVMKKGTVELIR